MSQAPRQLMSAVRAVTPSALISPAPLICISALPAFFGLHVAADLAPQLFHRSQATVGLPFRWKTAVGSTNS